MSHKPVILLYDLNNKLVDDCAKMLGHTGLYTAINTYNETNAIEVTQQYNRGFGLLTNKLSCIIMGWNRHKRPRDQFLFRLRAEEGRSPFRNPTPVIMITEDHRRDLKLRALDPTQGNVAAYLQDDEYHSVLVDTLHKIVFANRASELNSVAYAKANGEEESD